MNPAFWLLVFRDTLNIIWLASALFLGGIIEPFLWKTSLFELFNQPINQELFGANKRWRGLISLPLTHAASVFFLHWVELQLGVVSDGGFILFSDFNWWEYGLLVGLVFNLAELPNSYLKRRLGIPPGDESNPWFFFVDHADSTYGTLLLWYFYFNFPLHLVLTGFVVAPLLFMGATLVRKSLGLK